MKRILLLLFLSVITANQYVSAQVRSVGHDFWFSLGGDQGWLFSSTPRVRITAVENSDVTIYYTSNNSSINFSMSAGDIKTVMINSTLASSGQAEVINNQSVHISSTGNISMSLLAPNGSDDDATLLLPADQPGYGSVFYPVTYKVQQQNVSPLDFTITCSCDSTVLEITPAQESASGHPPGTPYQITLNEGQTYECGTTWDILNYPRDMTGWKVKILNSTCCNPINMYITSPAWYIFPDTIFGGSSCCADSWIEVVYPQESWDTVHYFVPFKYLPYDIIRIFSATNSNPIYFDNALVGTINSGEFLEAAIDSAVKIKSDAPVEIMQFMQSDGGDLPWWNGDPSLLTVNGLRDTISKTKFTTSYPFTVDTFKHVANVVILSSDTDLLLLNSSPVVSGFHPYTIDPLYSWSQIDLDTGVTYILECNCGFSASVYGEYVQGSYANQLPNLRMPYAPLPPTIFEADTTCGVPSLLQALNGISYQWEDGSTQSTFNATDTGLYYVYIQLTECDDTFQFFYVIPAEADSITAPGDTLNFCGDTVQLMASVTGQSYLWSTGATTQSIIVNSEGSYSVLISLTACSEIYETHEVAPAEFIAGSSRNDTVLFCKNPVLLTADAGLSYQWSTGETTSSITVDAPGTLDVVITTSPCVYDTVNYFILPPVTSLVDFSLGNDTVICFGDSLTLKTPYANTLWSTGETGKEIIVSVAGLISAEVADSCTDEIFSDSINISQQVCSCDPLFPNAFTPNADGMNDLFSPIMAPDCDYLTYRLQIFNRWGQLIFDTNDPNAKWDGSFSAIKQPIGVYVYLCSYSINDSGSSTVNVKKGNVTLLR